MKHNNLKEKFNNFNPIPQPGDWEKMEELLDKSSSGFSFLVSVITALVTSGGLFLLYSYNFGDTGDLPAMKSPPPVVVIENSLPAENACETASRPYQAGIDATGVIERKESPASPASSALNTIGKDFSLKGQKTTLLNASVLSEEKASLSFSSENKRSGFPDEKAEKLYPERPEEKIGVFPLQNIPFAIRKDKRTELHSALYKNKTNLRWLEVSVHNSLPVSLNNNATAFSYLGTLGLTFSFNTLYITVKAGRSTIVPSTEAVLSSVKVSESFLDRRAPKSSSQRIHSTHFEFALGKTILLTRKISIRPFAGFGMMNFEGNFAPASNISSEFVPGTDVNNAISEDGIKNVKENMGFIQAGITGHYHFNARLNLHTGFSYQNTLSSESYPLRFFTPVVGLGYLFSL